MFIVYPTFEGIERFQSRAQGTELYWYYSSSTQSLLDLGGVYQFVSSRWRK